MFIAEDYTTPRERRDFLYNLTQSRFNKDLVIAKVSIRAFLGRKKNFSHYAQLYGQQGGERESIRSVTQYSSSSSENESTVAHYEIPGLLQ